MLLTRKQLEVFRLKKEGFLNKEIADKLEVSEAHISQTLTKIAGKILNIEDTVAVLTQLGEFEDVQTYKLTEEGAFSVCFDVPAQLGEQRALEFTLLCRDVSGGAGLVIASIHFE